MQTMQAPAPPRVVTLSPAGMAVAVGALAFLRGLFALPFVIFHNHMGMMGGAMGWHHGARSLFAFPLHWLAGIVIAALAGALFAVIYNAVATRMERKRDANASTPA